MLIAFFSTASAHALSEAEIQRFIDDAIKAGGGEVVIPPGVHVIERGLMLKDAKKLRLIGLNAEESVLKAGPNAISLFLLGGACEEVRIEKLTFEGGQDAATEMAEPGLMNKLAKVHVGRCFFQNQRRSAVLLPTAAIEALEIEDCSFRDIAGTAVVFGERMSGCSITHNHVTRCQTGVQLTGSQRCLVASNEISACGTGVLVTAATDTKSIEQGNVIALNAIDGSGETAIQFNSRTLKNSVLRNEISRSGKNGIILAGEGQIVKANQITGSGMQAIAINEGKHDIEAAK